MQTSQRQYITKIVTRNRKFIWLSAGTDQRPVVGEGFAGFQFNFFGDRVKRSHALIGADFDTIVFIECLVAEEHPLIRSLSLQVVLRAVGAVVGNFLALGQHDNSARESAFAQGFSSKSPRPSAAYNHAGLRIGFIGRDQRVGSALLIGSEPHKHLIAFDTHLMGCQAIEGRCFEPLPIPNIKTGIMPGANEPVTIEETFLQRGLIVGTFGIERVKLPIDTGQQHIGIAHTNVVHLTVGQIIDPANGFFCIIGIHTR